MASHLFFVKLRVCNMTADHPSITWQDCTNKKQLNPNFKFKFKQLDMLFFGRLDSFVRVCSKRSSALPPRMPMNIGKFLRSTLAPLQHSSSVCLGMLNRSTARLAQEARKRRWSGWRSLGKGIRVRHGLHGPSMEKEKLATWPH